MHSGGLPLRRRLNNSLRARTLTLQTGLTKGKTSSDTPPLDKRAITSLVSQSEWETRPLLLAGSHNSGTSTTVEKEAGLLGGAPALADDYSVYRTRQLEPLTLKRYAQKVRQSGSCVCEHKLPAKTRRNEQYFFAYVCSHTRSKLFQVFPKRDSNTMPSLC